MKSPKFLILLAATAVTLCGCWDSGEQTPPAPSVPQTPTVAGPEPTATIPSPDNPMVIILADGDPDVGPAPLTVQFMLSDPFMELIDPDIQWDFGDGSPPSNERNPKHVYERPGKYTARVVVKEFEDEDEDTLDIVVQEPEAGKGEE
jgi:PKD repeat protein